MFVLIVQVLIGIALPVISAAIWLGLGPALHNHPIWRSTLAAGVPPLVASAALWQIPQIGLLLAFGAFPLALLLCALPVLILQRRALRRG